MSYFLVYATEDYVKCKKFENNYLLQDYLQDYYEECNVKFLDKIPEDPDDLIRACFDGRCEMILIKGEIIVPKAVEIVKKFDIK
jgi:hypothetical protein